jgi:competence protein ComEA
MTQPRMRVGGATLALLLVSGVIARWYWSNTPPPRFVVTHPAASEPHPAAASTSPAPPASQPAAAPTIPTAAPAHQTPAAGLPETPAIMIHVVGAVRHPGLYRLPSKARLADALHAAGGPRSGADLEAVNLASFVQDGEQVRVPTLAERPSLRAAAPIPHASRSVPTTLPPRPVRTTARYPLAAAAATTGTGRSSAASASASQPNAPVNINTAGAEELDSLPGVGPATAAAILDFRREHGPFQRVEDLLGVRGIGEKKLARMRARVTVQ